jgi:hypothetical protein
MYLVAPLLAWTKHAGLNCYSGHGGQPVDPSDQPLASKSAAQCGDACVNKTGCTAFTVMSNTASGDCWLRASINLASCDTYSNYDTYDRSAPPPPAPPPTPRPVPFALVKRIGSKGVNLGNILEAPHEGDWAAPIEEYAPAPATALHPPQTGQQAKGRAARWHAASVSPAEAARAAYTPSPAGEAPYCARTLQSTPPTQH